MFNLLVPLPARRYNGWHERMRGGVREQYDTSHLVAAAPKSRHGRSSACGLSLPTLQRAARSLESKILVRRQVRRDKSNKWWINVTLLQQQAAEVKAAEEAKRKPAEYDECPFDAPEVAESTSDSDTDDTSDWITGGAR